MDDQSEFFDEALQAKGVGRRLVHDAVTGPAKVLFDMVPQVVQKQLDALNKSAPLVRPAPKIIGGVNNDHRFNAYAFKYQDVYIIAVNWGTLIAMGDLMCNLLCIPEVFPWIGNSSTLPSTGVFPPIKCNSTSDISAFLDARLLIMPADTHRQIAAQLMTYYILDLLIWHEFRHITAGHVDCFESEYGLSSLREFGAERLTAEQAMVRQAMETDADEFATRFSMLHMLGIANTTNQLGESVRWLLSDELHTVEVASVCAYLFFRILDSPLGRVEDWDYLDHPPNVFRQFSVIVVATHVLADEQFADVWSRSWKDPQWRLHFFTITEKVFAARFGGTFSLTDWSTVLGSEGQAHRERIAKCWNALLPTLSRFSYIKLMKYNDAN